MNTVGGWQKAVGRWSIAASVFCLFTFYFCLSGCSIPNLESAECSATRIVVREFYSLHFGNDGKFSRENLDLREKFLTPEFAERLRGRDTNIDPFTLTDDLPKTFRAGVCKVTEPGKHARFEVLLLWKTDTQSVERSINVEVVNIDGNWLIDGVGVEKRQK